MIRIREIMKKKISISVLALAGIIGTMNPAKAGNEDRAGSAGATELLVNPWARTSAWANAGVSCVKGLEGTFMNVAGLAFTKGTEVQFTRTSWLTGAGINFNAIGIGQKIGEKNVLGLTFVSMNFGEIDITTVDIPEGGLGTFTPRYNILGLSYAREFSNSIYGGATVKIVNENINNMGATGVAIDAGIQYVTGEKDQIKFGITLKNVGPPMKFKGDGLAFSVTNPIYGATFNTEQRTARFELPSQVNIGASYDFIFNEKHTLTAALNYVSNSFTRDQYALGFEYKWDIGAAKFLARAGYLYERGIFSATERATALTGPSAGASVEVGLGKSGSNISFDYSFRATNPFAGIHSFGVRLDIQ
jgi:hypothetical protein